MLKICGIQTIADIHACLFPEVTALGIIMTEESTRCVTLTRAKELVAQIKQYKKEPVLVVRSIATATLCSLVDELAVTTVQCHGGSSIESQKALSNNIRRIMVAEVNDLGDMVNPDVLQQIDVSRDCILYDRQKENQTTSLSLNFVPQPQQHGLAGGISAVTIQNYQAFSPLFFDVCSSVETQGKKDAFKIKQFIQKIEDMKNG